MTIVEQQNKDRLPISQFVLSLLALLFTLIAAVGFFAGGSIFNQYLELDEQTIRLFYSLGSFSILLSVIHGYSLLTALKKVPISPPSNRRKLSPFNRATAAFLLLIVFCLLQLLPDVQRLCAAFYPFLTPLAVVIPAWWFVEFGKRNLPAVSARKISAALSLGSSYTMLFILLLEIIFVACILAAALIYLSSQPSVQQMMKSFSFPADLTQIETSFVERYLRTTFQKPLFVLGIFLVLGLVIPLIEESIKPIALWSLQKRSLKPTDGFILGLYFGAAFALVESTLAISQTDPQMWVESITLRAAASLIHITCTGLVGYGYAATMKSQKKAAIHRPFLTAIVIHGLWNSLALLSSANLIMTTLNITQPLAPIYDILIPSAFAIEWIAILYLLSQMNKSLRHNSLRLSHNETTDTGVHTNDVE